MTGEIILVVARADNGVIGRDGQLPWHLPEDLKHFKRVTMGTPMIMGRKTFESLPGLLPGRRHIVLTRAPGWSADGAEIAHDAEEAERIAASDRISVIGGAEIFSLFMPRASRIELTEVHLSADGDISIAAPDPRIWQETGRERHEAVDGRPAFSFVTLRRKG